MNKSTRLKLGPKSRVKKRQEFLNIQDKGHKLQSKLLLLFIRQVVRDRANGSRLGITVSKRVHKHANKRNLIRRRIREAFRVNQNLIKRPCDFIVIAKNEAVAASYQELESCILRLLAQAKLLDESLGGKTTARQE